MQILIAFPVVQRCCTSAYTLFFILTHVCSGCGTLSSVSLEADEPVDGSAQKWKCAFAVTLQESLMDWYNMALDL